MHHYFLSYLLSLTLTVISIGQPSNPASQRPLQDKAGSSGVAASPLEYAVLVARKSNNSYALSEIAARYAELGDFEQAVRVVETVEDDNDKASSLSKIALQYWKQGNEEASRQLFARVAGMATPKDGMYVWDDVMGTMAEAQQFDTALDVAASMPESEAMTTRAALEAIVDKYIAARAKKREVPDILPRVLRIGRTLAGAGEEESVITKVAVAYAARGETDRALKLIQGLDEDYDRPNASHEIAIQLAKARQYDGALQLAAKSGDYFGPIAFVQIAAEALKNRDKSRAAEILAPTLSRLLKDIERLEEHEGASEADRMAEIALLYAGLGQKPRAVELMAIAFKRAKAVGKPGERYGALRGIVAAYAQLGLYTEAVEAARAFDNSEPGIVAEVAAKAVEQRASASTSQIIKAIWEMPVKDNKSEKVAAVASIAVNLARRNQKTEALKLLQVVAEFADTAASDRDRPKALKSVAVAFAEAGDFQRAFERMRAVKDHFFITWGLLEIGTLWAKSGQTLNERDARLLDEIANIKLAPPREPARLVKEEGWEIPGLAQSHAIGAREIFPTRDKTIERYRTLYEPTVETFMKRPFGPDVKQNASESQTEKLKIIRLEEHDIRGRKYCYVVITQPILIDEITNSRKYSASFEHFLYYDEDGDGKFETLEEGASLFPRPRIPDWVMKENR